MQSLLSLGPPLPQLDPLLKLSNNCPSTPLPDSHLTEPLLLKLSNKVALKFLCLQKLSLGMMTA
jgi:hypothetical protein